ncbi:MAG: hybrid sensor histidine kinase/response regulator [Cyanobacteria bacterium J06626_14]
MSANNSRGISRILAVDDSPDNLFLIETILDEVEYDLTCVERGSEALSQVAKAPPDLILLDIMMPEMNGYEVTRRIREDGSLPYIPILLVTAHNQTSLVEGLDAGADDFIRKPFDIDELQARMRSLLRLKRAMDDQAHMIRQRDDFVARLTHDLRTPIIAANRMLQFCRDGVFGSVADEAKDAIAETIQNNKQLLGMVNTLLEVYRHEAGHKALTDISVDLHEITAAVVNELRPLANDKKLDLKVIDVGEDIKAYRTRGDAMELRRVITNLVGNAIKFTDKGHVHLELQVTVQTPPEVSSQGVPIPDRWIILRVKDTGIGIAPEDQAEVFKWFCQGKQRRSGSGLGLHLAYRIVAMHGGFIDVDSTLNQGSTFTVYLPKVVAS